MTLLYTVGCTATVAEFGIVQRKWAVKFFPVLYPFLQFESLSSPWRPCDIKVCSIFIAGRPIWALVF